MGRWSRSSTVTFGLVSVPVKMYSTITSEDSTLCNVHTVCGSRVRMPKVCPTCNKEVPSSELGKAYPLSKTEVVPLTKEELAGLPLATMRSIKIEAFTKTFPSPQYLMDNSAYFIGPDGEKGLKAFALLFRVMQDDGIVAIGKFVGAEGGKENLCLLYPYDDGVIVMQKLNWSTELQPYEDLAIKNMEVDSKFLALGKQLINGMTTNTPLTAYINEYEGALQDLVAAKAKGLPAPVAAAAPKVTDDLEAMLTASLAGKEAK